MARISHVVATVATLGLAAPLPPGTAAQSHAPPSRLAPSAGIIGRVVDQQSRTAVGGASVALLGTARRTATDTGGRFTQAGLESGTYLLEVRAIGYGVTSWVLRLRQGEVLEFVFELAPLGVDLDPVIVEARPGYAERRRLEFEERRRSGRGIFFTQGQIEAKRAATVGDLLRGIPGVRLNCRSGVCTVHLTRGARGSGCIADWVVDGAPASVSGTPHLPVVGIVGIEIYPSLSDTPAELLTANSQCGVIAIWTKSGP